MSITQTRPKRIEAALTENVYTDKIILDDGFAWRVGIQTGEYTSGTADVVLVQGKKSEKPILFLSGTFVATVRLFVSEDDGVSWHKYLSSTVPGAFKIDAVGSG